MNDEDRKLISNVQEQLHRLMTQLADIEQEKASLDIEEYTEMKNDTMEQLKDLGETLDRMQCGDVTLTDQLTATRIAIRAAISEAFKTPEIVAIFAKKQPALLRQKLMQVDTEFHLHKISEEVHNARKAEILYALLKMGAELSREEEDFLSNYSKIPSANFELTSEQKICNESLLNVSM
uniref:Beta-catenin-interacting ICAT domain-containing protein n=1 Tax=Parascaris univalens TaxID=6257 RepID=A0A915AKE1_PARUN